MTAQPPQRAIRSEAAGLQPFVEIDHPLRLGEAPGRVGSVRSVFVDQRIATELAEATGNQKLLGACQ